MVGLAGTTLTELLAVRQIQGSMSVPLHVRLWKESLERFRRQYPGRIAADWPHEEIVSWHQRQQDDGRFTGDWFAGQWHLDRLTELIGDDNTVQSARATIAIEQASELATRGELTGSFALLENMLGNRIDFSGQTRPLLLLDQIGHLMESAGELEKAERIKEATLRFRHTFDPTSSNTLWTLTSLARVKTKNGKTEEGIVLLRQVIQLNGELGVSKLEASRSMRDLAAALSSIGSHHDAIGQYSQCLALNKGDVLALNNLAWLLATCPDPNLRNPTRAVELATEAVRLEPKKTFIFNTLGVAHYRNGKYDKAVEALNRSLEFAQGRNFGFDGYFLAMSYWRTGKQELAQRWYEKTNRWMDEKGSEDKELQRFRDEARALLTE